MAKLSADGKYVTVEMGDTLSEIAKKYMGSGTKTTYMKLASYNNIPDPNYIYPGQKIDLVDSKTTVSTSNFAWGLRDKRQLKIEMNRSASHTTEFTLYAVWKCNYVHVKEYEYVWEYQTSDTQDAWMEGNTGTISGPGDDVEITATNGVELTTYACTWVPSSNAIKVRFKVKAIPTEREISKFSNSKTYQCYDGKGNPIGEKVTLKDYLINQFGYSYVIDKYDKDRNNKYLTSFPKQDWVKTTAMQCMDFPPEKPPAPKIEIDHERNVLKVEIRGYPVEELLELGRDKTFTSNGIEYLTYTSISIDIIIDDVKVYRSIDKLAISRHGGYLSWESPIDIGHRYSVRCKARYKNTYDSDWVTTENVSSSPEPTELLSPTVTRNSATGGLNILLEWRRSKTAEKYKIQYAAVAPNVKPIFDNSDDGSVKTPIEVEDTGEEIQRFTLVSVDTGLVYYFRIASVLGNNIQSKWSKIIPEDGLVVGTLPGPPQTWSSASTVSVGEPIYLYWIHNPTDGSSETAAELFLELRYITQNGTEEIYQYTEYLSKDTSYEEKDQTSEFYFSTHPDSEWYDLIKNGAKLSWKVQTAGVSGELGNDPIKHWSPVNTINIYAPPKLTFEVTPHGDMTHTAPDSPTDQDFECSSFPLTIYAFAGPESQTPVSYHISIKSDTSYETVDYDGNDKWISTGDVLYSRYFDNETIVENQTISASDVNLDNGEYYIIECVVSMDSGLSASRAMRFKVQWSDESYIPDATVEYDPETYTTKIRPYCIAHNTNYYKVIQNGSQYLATDEQVQIVWGEARKTASGRLIRTSDIKKAVVYSGIAVDDDGMYKNEEILYYQVTTASTLVEGITLSVYRREYDGRFTKIATGLDNSKSIEVVDPHPALDYARYRIVAMVNDTGAISYSDIPGLLIGETGIIIQWDEAWSNFDITPSLSHDLITPAWTGSLIRLPYNIDVTPSYTIETALVEYAGRENPVSYYGTHVGETATWTAVIPKTDKETIYALHRLAKWRGNVYAREPSGMGYWATVGVQFPQKHLDPSVTVTLTLTRVEGGE